MPFFMYHGIILGNMSAFKAHCSLGLWGQEIAAQVRADGAASSEAMGTFGRIESMKDLPGNKQLIAYLKQAAKAIDDGTRTKSIERPAQRVAKPELEVLKAELAAAAGRRTRLRRRCLTGSPRAIGANTLSGLRGAKRDEDAREAK